MTLANLLIKYKLSNSFFPCHIAHDLLLEGFGTVFCKADTGNIVKSTNLTYKWVVKYPYDVTKTNAQIKTDSKHKTQRFAIEVLILHDFS